MGTAQRSIVVLVGSWVKHGESTKMWDTSPSVAKIISRQQPNVPCGHAQTRAADPGLRHEVTEVLDAMVSAGLTVLRTWAFCAHPPVVHVLPSKHGRHASPT